MRGNASELVKQRRIDDVGDDDDDLFVWVQRSNTSSHDDLLEALYRRCKNDLLKTIYACKQRAKSRGRDVQGDLRKEGGDALFSAVLLRLLQVITEHVGNPVDAVEESKHEGKEDARDDVNSLRSGGELGQPSLAPVLLPGWRHVHLTAALQQKRENSWLEGSSFCQEPLLILPFRRAAQRRLRRSRSATPAPGSTWRVAAAAAWPLPGERHCERRSWPEQTRAGRQRQRSDRRPSTRQWLWCSWRVAGRRWCQRFASPWRAASSRPVILGRRWRSDRARRRPNWRRSTWHTECRFELGSSWTRAWRAAPPLGSCTRLED